MTVDVDALAHNALLKTGAQVGFMIYGGGQVPYIAYQRILEQDQAFADDDGQAVEHHYRASLFAKGSYRHILATAKTELKRAGFYGISINADSYEKDTALFHVSFDFSYMTDVDDTESEV